MPHQVNLNGKARRGFAAMDPAKQRELASRGGKASHGGGRPPSKPKPEATDA